ncbi:aldo/keto reductase [Nonomuraea sp. bgisy101]|uniref:aldo/keto reductase n=1 Tax=Nonomuraea sp. bgisy101 TaxID=3413784 RepID=UPI003D739FB2
MRLFDTAPHYGLGLSERRLGAFLARRPRESFTLSTKVGRLLVPAEGGGRDDQGFDVPADHRRVWDFSADGVRRSLGDSLDRLGLSSIDIARVHDPPPLATGSRGGCARPAGAAWAGSRQGCRRRYELVAAARPCRPRNRRRPGHARRPLHPARPARRGRPPRPAAGCGRSAFGGDVRCCTSAPRSRTWRRSVRSVSA